MLMCYCCCEMSVVSLDLFEDSLRGSFCVGGRKVQPSTPARKTLNWLLKVKILSTDKDITGGDAWMQMFVLRKLISKRLWCSNLYRMLCAWSHLNKATFLVYNPFLSELIWKNDNGKSGSKCVLIKRKEKNVLRTSGTTIVFKNQLRKVFFFSCHPWTS